MQVVAARTSNLGQQPLGWSSTMLTPVVTRTTLSPGQEKLCLILQASLSLTRGWRRATFTGFDEAFHKMVCLIAGGPCSSAFVGKLQLHVDGV